MPGAFQRLPWRTSEEVLPFLQTSLLVDPMLGVYPGPALSALLNVGRFVADA